MSALSDWDNDRHQLERWGCVPVETSAGNKAEARHVLLFKAMAAERGPGYMRPKPKYRTRLNRRGGKSA